MEKIESNEPINPWEQLSMALDMIPKMYNILEGLKAQKEPQGIPYAGSIDEVMMPITGWKKSTCYLKLSTLPSTVAVKRSRSWTIYRDNLISWMQDV